MCHQVSSKNWETLYDIPVFFWEDCREIDDFEYDELSNLLGAMDMVGERMPFSLTLKYLFFL
jgi:hypothetical protein